MPGTDRHARRSRARSRSSHDGLLWLAGCACSMGLVQANALVPLILAPLGLGVGALGWGSGALLTFFGCQVAVFALDLLAWGRELPRLQQFLHMGWPQVALLCAGWFAVASQGSPRTGVHPVVPLVGAGIMGTLHACATLESHRFMARLDAAWSNPMICLAATVSCAICLIYASVPSPALALAGSLFPLLGALLFRHFDVRRPLSATVPDHQPAELLGISQAADCRRAAVVIACTFALGVFTLRLVLAPSGTLVASDGLTLGGWASLAALALGLICAVGALWLLVLKGTGTVSLTFILRIGLPPLIVAAALVFVCGNAVPAISIALLAFALTFIDQGHRLISTGFLRSGVHAEDIYLALARCGQAAGIIIATLLAKMVEPGATPITGQLLIAVLAVAFVICVPAHEPHILGSAGKVKAASATIAGRERYLLPAMRFDLTARETEILALLAEGLDAPEIARILCISRPTVNTHIQHIYAKVGVHSKAELLARTEVLGK